MQIVETDSTPADDLLKIEAAAPATAPATPAKPRSLLVVSSAPMFYHEAIPWGNEALRILGEKTGAYTATFDNSPEAFERENLDKFDAVCFNNTCGELVEEDRLKQNLVDYAKDGGGFVGIHCSAHTFLKFPDYGLLNGAYSRDHPWMREVVTVRLEDPSHPCVSSLPSRFDIVDEIYQFEEVPYSRKRLRVLASIDATKTDMKKEAIIRTDGDFGLAWVQKYGKGRVFYSAFGHFKNLYWDPQILEHYLAGIQFAFGDLEADTTPSSP